jgi:hypothetical protein
LRSRLSPSPFSQQAAHQGLPKLPPSQRPRNQSDLCRSGQTGPHACAFAKPPPSCRPQFQLVTQRRHGLGCMGVSEFYATRDDQESIAGIHRATGFGVKYRAFRARTSAGNSLQTS